MVMEIFLGTMSVLGMAGGISALVLYRKQNNGHKPERDPWRYDPPLQPQPSQMIVMEEAEDQQLANLAEAIQSLAALPKQLEAGFELAVERLANTLEEHLNAPQPEPDWPADLLQGVQRLYDLEASRIDVAANLERLTHAVEAFVQMESQPPTIINAPPPPFGEELVRGLAELPGKIGQKLSEMVASERKVGGGSGPPPRIRREPPSNLPRITPGMQPVIPQIPTSYVGGTVLVPAGQPASLLLLIQLQLDPNCPGTSAEFSLSTEDDIFVGASSKIGGPLSATNFAYQLTPDNSPRTYRSTYPGNNTPIGELQVFASGGGSLNVEVHQ